MSARQQTDLQVTATITVPRTAIATIVIPTMETDTTATLAKIETTT